MVPNVGGSTGGKVPENLRDPVVQRPDDVTDALRALANPEGIDIEIDVLHGDRHYTYLSQTTPTAEGAWVRALTGLPDKVVDILDKAENVLDLALDRAKAGVERGLNLVGDPPVAYTYRKPVGPGCTPFEKVGVRRAMQTVASAVSRSGVKQTVTFVNGSSVESSTGASIGGGLFSINGSRSRSTSLRGKYKAFTSTATRPVNIEYQVESLHLVMRRSCARDFQGNEDVLVVTSPAGGTGGGQPVPSQLPAWRCGQGSSRTVVADFEEIGTDEDEAKTYESGFSFAPTGGSSFTGRSLSGYSKSVGVTFHFGEDRKGFWCGDSGFPLSPGQRVQGFQR